MTVPANSLHTFNSDESTLPGLRPLRRGPKHNYQDSGFPAFPVPSWDRYRPLIFLGAGGMGLVFKALDPVLGRAVALKFIQREEADAEFLREAQAQARIDHPNVCKVYEVGIVQGHPYIAMQFVNGQSLRRVQGDLGLELKVRIIQQVSEAVHAAHRLGLIHRDLKPSNVLVEFQEETGWKPYVMDFGLAKDVAKTTQSTHGKLQGTPAYMSPEQARGDTLDRRSDVYSLGATLYECLAGRPPFEAETLLDLIHKIQEASPKPLRQLNPNIPAELEIVVLRCLAKEPERRYESAKALAEDLQRFLDGNPILARPPSLIYRLRKLVIRNRMTAAMGVAALLLLGLFGATSLRAIIRARVQGQVAQSLQREVDQMEYVLRIAQSMPIHDIRPELGQIHRKMDHIVDLMQKLGEPAKGPGYYALGRAYLMLGDYETARGHLERAWDLGFRTPEVASALGLSLGRLYQVRLAELGSIKNAARFSGPLLAYEIPEETRKQLESQLLIPALDYLKQGEGSMTSAQRLYFDGLIALYEHQTSLAVQKARDILREAPWTYEAWLLEAEAQRLRSMDLLRLGRMDDAREALQQNRIAIERAGELVRSSPSVFEAETLHGYTSMLIRLEARESIDSDFEATLTSVDRSLQNNPTNWVAYTHLALLHLLKGEHLNTFGKDPRPSGDDAIAAARKALDLKPDFTWARGVLAASLTSRAEWGRRLFGEDPRSLVKHALEEYQHILDAGLLVEPVLLQMGQCNDAMALWEAAHGLEARDTFLKSVDFYERAGKIKPTAEALFGKALPLKWIGILERAAGRDPLPSFNQSIHAYQAGLGLAPRNYTALGRYADVLLWRARVLLEKGGDPKPDIQAALQQATSCDELRPDSFLGAGNIGEAHLLMARTLVDHGQNPASELALSEKAIRRALQSKPNLPELLLDLGAIERERLRWSIRESGNHQVHLDRGLDYVDSVLRQFPSNAMAYRLRGELLTFASLASPNRKGMLMRDAHLAFHRCVELNRHHAREVQSFIQMNS